jgi:hypothetical protein
LQNNQLTAAEYIRELSRGLSDLARVAGLPWSHFLLEMTYLDACDQIYRLSKPDPTQKS